MLSPTQLQSFAERGYVKIVGLLTEEEVAPLRERLEDVLHGRVTWQPRMFQTLDPQKFRAPSGSPMPEGIQRPALVDEQFQRVAEHPKLLAMVRDLIGENATLYTDQVILKTPGIGVETHFHQDGFYWRNSAERTVNCWIALDDADADNGCLRFLPGSHKGGLIEHEAYYDTPALHHGETGAPFQRLRIPLKQVDFSCEVPEPAQAGDCLIFTKYTWHRSEPNWSAQPRRAYAIAFHAPV